LTSVCWTASCSDSLSVVWMLRTFLLNATSLPAFHFYKFPRAGNPRANPLCLMEGTGLSGMCGSTGDWLQTLRSMVRPRKRATLTRNFCSRRGGFGEKPACNESLEISASPFATRAGRRCGACATLWEPVHSIMRTSRRFLRSAIPFRCCERFRKSPAV
jgi:hypothetical protein